jgi:SET domain-containing protein
MLHPDTVIRHVSEAVGVGVFATRRIPRGTVTWVRDPLDIILPTAQVRELHPLQQAIMHRYSWREGEKWILCWDHGRYVNHSCDANCVGLGVQFEIALRDIEAGEQLTDDYRSLGAFEDPFECMCGSARCTGSVLPSDLPRVRPLWESRFAAALPEFHQVAQPLLAFVSAADLAVVDAAREPMAVRA